MKKLYIIICLLIAALSSYAGIGSIIEKSGVKGGIIVCIGEIEGKTLVELRKNDSFLVQGLDTDPARIQKAREYIHSKDLYGKVSVDYWDGKNLPYVDNCVNAIIVKGDTLNVKGEEINRVLAPRGAVIVPEKLRSQVSALSSQSVGDWFVGRKPVPTDIDSWPHFLHGADNNAVANDKVVAPPKKLQWQANPLYCRSHEIESSIAALVSADGRIFYILDEQLQGIIDERLPAKWGLYARDAFNGTQLWRRPLSEWGWQVWNTKLKGKDWTVLRGQRGRIPVSITRRLVASNNKIFVTLGYSTPLSILDAATGKTIHTCKNTEGTDEIIFHKNTLIISIKSTGNEEKERRGEKPEPDKIAAVDPDTGSILWEKPLTGVQALSLSAIDDNVVVKAGGKLVCLDFKSGKEKWTTEYNKSGTVVLYKNMILCRAGRTIDGFSIKDGSKKYSIALNTKGIADDLLVIRDLIWNSTRERGLIPEDQKYWDMGRDPQTDVLVNAYDPVTGKEVKSFLARNSITPGHHARCYRSKATDNFVLWPKRGTEFINITGDNHMKNDWLRGACRYGIMPANGLLYSPPNQCFCYTGVNIRGFNALAGGPSVAKAMAGKRRKEDRLEKGPAYSKILNLKSEFSDKDWRAFRNGYKRHGSTPEKVKAKVREDWKLNLGSPLSQPVVVGKYLYVARVDAQELVCIDRKKGKTKWTFTAGGRIDSPPAIHNGCAIFGSRDGYVYCLLADTGELAWKFRAAPVDQRSGFFDQVESVWPVNGAVLVINDTVYASAGRHSFVDGGIHVYGLNPKTGEIKCQTVVEGPYPDMKKDIGEPFDMQGCFADVLVSDGKYIYIQQVMMDLELKQVEAEKITRMGDRKFGMHVFTTAGFLDGSGWNRTFWMNTERYPGFYIANQSPKSGQILVADNNSTYAVKCFYTRNVHSPMFFPGTKGYLLFADDNKTEPTLKGQPGAPAPIKWLPKLTMEPHHYRGSAKDVDFGGRSYNFDKGTGLARPAPPLWQEWHPIRVRGMVLAGDTLFIAGPPDVLDEKDPMAAFEGRKGAIMRAVSAKEGKTLNELKLDVPPVYDGLIAAHGALYMSMWDGSVRCFK